MQILKSRIELNSMIILLLDRYLLSLLPWENPQILLMPKISTLPLSPLSMFTVKTLFSHYWSSSKIEPNSSRMSSPCFTPKMPLCSTIQSSIPFTPKSSLKKPVKSSSLNPLKKSLTLCQLQKSHKTFQFNLLQARNSTSLKPRKGQAREEKIQRTRKFLMRRWKKDRFKRSQKS